MRHGPPHGVWLLWHASYNCLARATATVALKKTSLVCSGQVALHKGSHPNRQMAAQGIDLIDMSN